MPPEPASGLHPPWARFIHGHLSLFSAARAENDIVVASIFINPTQFNNPEDFTNYPKTLVPTFLYAKRPAVTCVFTPEASVLYPRPAMLKFTFGALEAVMEGAHRPGHFNGVATIVSKLFHLVQPQRAYFGQKDLQQFCIIRQLVQDLSFQLELVCCPTVREADGLAMSSRNTRLSASERAIAPQLYKALLKAESLLAAGQRPAAAKQAVTDHLAAFPEISLEYFEIADARTLQPVQDPTATPEIALCLAAHLGPVRLIDNLVVKLEA